MLVFKGILSVGNLAASERAVNCVI